MKVLVTASRIIVGTLFILSGLIKANDPLGFAYKLEEYWVEFGMGWDWLISLGVPLAAFLCILEIVLGFATLLGYRMKQVSMLLLLIIVFFTILTFASAVFDLVKSCGCFGDAIPLTPWQSFIKDLVLLAFILVLYLRRNDIKEPEDTTQMITYIAIPVPLAALFSYQVDWNFPMYFTMGVLLLGFVVAFVDITKAAMATTAISIIGSVWFTVYCITHLPVKDYRPYAVSKSIPEQMEIPEGGQPDIYENIFEYKNKTTGEVETFNDSNYPWDDDNYEFVDRKTKLIKEGDRPKIMDFSIIAPDGNDYTQDFLHDPSPIFMFISYDLAAFDVSKIEEMITFTNACYENGASIVGLTAASYEEMDDFRHTYQLPVDFYSTDGTTLKTIVRANPGLILIQEGIIKAKWHNNDFPTFDEAIKVLENN